MFGGEESEPLRRIGMIAPSMLSPHPPTQQPQWGQEETRELIAIRGELERDFTVSKRNKALWEVVSTRMRERGYIRTPDQCKCKWKNLLNRYKQGKETSDPDTGRQCPFFEELQAVFNERAKNMQRMLLESEAGLTQAKKRMKRVSVERSSEEFSEYEDEEEDESEEERRRSNSRKRKVEKNVLDKSPRATTSTTAGRINSSSSLQEMLKEFLQQQQTMEIQWREMMERRANERRLFEQEWRQSMEKLERERLMVEQAWREREEQRRIREDSRAERRDALLTTLLNKLINDNNL
ncbi:hypothetical protein SLEP1_g21892 [Rubroshorea leprosula]|uniref:Myb-like domain-containing protein n=1 Tax=Rubroshorea leprosula TaxID=152421 RepID=A0AAV5JDK1_9ROSI|nr:hypothetical protein SLEP1_g21892 [Rubroshorea leprosula]